MMTRAAEVGKLWYRLDNMGTSDQITILILPGHFNEQNSETGTAQEAEQINAVGLVTRAMGPGQEEVWIKVK